jgi:predicted DNA-binding transcriptional regulator YafY
LRGIIAAMRADRLVATLLLLQARGRVTAAEVARELEISVKTARRDLDALSAAGIPVYAQVGRGGGWSLLGGARTDLTGLTADEARALFLLAAPTARLDPRARSALRKLVQALPPTFRPEAEAAADTVVLDPSRWGHEPIARPPRLDDLQQVVIEGVRIRLTYVNRSGRLTQRTADPLGLVEKQGVWYLVAGTPAGLRSFRVSRVEHIERTAERAVRPAGFDLGAAWDTALTSFDRDHTRASATVRVPTEALGWLRATFGRALVDHGETADGRTEAEVSGPSAEHIAQQLAAWGGAVEVVEPAEVRGHLARIGAELVAQYGDGPVGSPGMERPALGPRRA